MICPGLPDDTITLHLGYGATSGSVGTTREGEWLGRGVNAYLLRDSTSLGFQANVQAVPTGTSGSWS